VQYLPGEKVVKRWVTHLDRRNMLYKRTILTITVFSCLALFASCSARNSLSSSNLQILQHTMNNNTFSTSSPESSATVTGMAQNNGNTPINSAIITVKFYNKDDSVVETSSASRQNLTPGETWIFAVQSSGPDAWKITHYEISASTK
jgi:hypothetical protein